VNQEDSEQNEVDRMKKGADADEVMHHLNKKALLSQR